MPSKEIKALRQADKLTEALEMALSELNVQPENIWAKRNLCWVYYDYAKKSLIKQDFESFCQYFDKILELQMPDDETILNDCMGWLIRSMLFHHIVKQKNQDFQRIDILFQYSKKLSLSKPSDVYSALFKLFHKAYKENGLKYLEFADWWNFENFRNEDYQKEKLSNEKTMMSIVEQAYITYAKHLLPGISTDGEAFFNKEKAVVFLSMLDKIEIEHPEYQYPPYYKAKLLLAMGEKDNILSSLLPFVRKKRNDFWAWDILSEAFQNDEEKIFACYCKGLSCPSPEEMTVKLRTKIVTFFMKKEMWNEAKTEIQLIGKIYHQNGWNIPSQITYWMNHPWFSSSKENMDNQKIYLEYALVAEEILYNDIEEETVLVTFVNSEKKILNFIASENKYGFLKYNRFLKSIRIGETLKVRFLKKETFGCFQVATLRKSDNFDFKKMYIIEFQGVVKKNEDKKFGFVDEVFLTPDICIKNKLKNGNFVKGNAIKTFNENNNRWGWKAYELLKI